ncbi:MAG: hypothetical protein KatS3mg105_0458 [Gemmatales bacterium]|nr:MAG: hypothetical protein KatS3mg105_0458 [Gemmatales bacterium]
MNDCKKRLERRKAQVKKEQERLKRADKFTWKEGDIVWVEPNSPLKKSVRGLDRRGILAGVIH